MNLDQFVGHRWMNYAAQRFVGAVPLDQPTETTDEPAAAHVVEPGETFEAEFRIVFHGSLSNWPVKSARTVSSPTKQTADTIVVIAPV